MLWMSMEKPKSISVIIITLNESKRIGKLLTDLSQQSYQHFEVIVSDSDSDDNTREVANSYHDILPDLTVHNMQARGVSRGRNTGASLAKYERLLFLDADVHLDKHFLSKAIKFLDKKDLEVAGVYMNARKLPLHYCLGYSLFNVGLFATSYFFPTAVGACVFSTKQAHEKLGGFDEAITLCEDCDYVNRASKISKFRLLPLTFSFDPRRLQQDGFLGTGLIYLKANIYRFFNGEMRNNEMDYQFNHYKEDN